LNKQKSRPEAGRLPTGLERAAVFDFWGRAALVPTASYAAPFVDRKSTVIKAIFLSIVSFFKAVHPYYQI